jgi:hypothetical protein
MKRKLLNIGRFRNLSGAGIVVIGLLIWSATAEEPLPQHSLRALEYRALLAQSLIEKVDELEVEIERLRSALSESEVRLSSTRTQLDENRRETDALRQHIEVQEKELESRDRLLAVFRSGSFEYYEVREGDTLESIAGNPMVYGNSSRVVWLQQANNLEESATLTPGTVLMIPRFPEGVQHDL